MDSHPIAGLSSVDQGCENLLLICLAPFPFLFSSRPILSSVSTRISAMFVSFSARSARLSAFSAEERPETVSLSCSPLVVGARSEPFIKDRNGIPIWIELLLYGHKISHVFTLIPIAVLYRPAFDREILEHPRVVLLCFLEPEGKA